MFVHNMYEKKRKKYLHIVKTKHFQNMPNYIRKKNARKLMPAYFEWTQIHLSHAKPLKSIHCHFNWSDIRKWIWFKNYMILANTI